MPPVMCFKRGFARFVLRASGRFALGRIEDRGDDVGRHRFEAERLHRIGGAAFRQRTDRGGVAEHFGQRHFRVEHGLAVLGFDADDLAAAAVDVAEQIALIFIRRGALRPS